MFYFELARKHMALLGSDEGTPEKRLQQLDRAFEAFRAPRPGRQIPDSFYRLLGEQYRVHVEAGEQHLVKAIAARRDVDKSTASKWLAEARRRGYLAVPGEEANDG
jgi:hypothetical protein